jgi:hypothetical protein
MGWHFIQAVAAARPDIESMTVEELTSDRVLSFLRPGLEGLGYKVEAGKAASQKIRRSVLFGDSGRERVAYEVDAVHDELGAFCDWPTPGRPSAFARRLMCAMTAARSPARRGRSPASRS